MSTLAFSGTNRSFSPGVNKSTKVSQHLGIKNVLSEDHQNEAFKCTNPTVY